MNLKSTFFQFFILVFTLFLFGCSDEISELPTLVTNELKAINHYSAVSGGTISNQGEIEILKRGICWSTSEQPTIDDYVTVDGDGNGVFVSRLSDLLSSTQYYVRAYATYGEGVIYGNELTFSTKSSFSCGDDVSDFDGNIYTTVNIGNQCWMQQNITTTKYNDGDVIPSDLDNDSWLYATTGAYSTYGNNDELNSTYGKLYNWYVVKEEKLCPKGWHIPSKEEWTELIEFLGGESEAGGKLKARTIWQTPNTGATNNSGFTGLPGGFRFDIRMSPNVGFYGYWWSSSEVSEYTATSINLSYSNNDAKFSTYGNVNGLSCRCIKD